MNFAYYNFCKIHGGLRTTPAQAAGEASGRLRNWSGVVESKREYTERIQRLQLAIEHLHNCRAKHVGTDFVDESFEGKLVWVGEVEVFDLTGHPKAEQCYSWSYRDDTGEKIATVLRVRPVRSALDAVRVSIVADAKKQL